MHEEAEGSGSETCGTETDSCTTEDISGTVIRSDHVSQATQTDVVCNCISHYVKSENRLIGLISITIDIDMCT